MTCLYCEKPAKSKGLCAGHSMRVWRYGDPLHVPSRPRGTRDMTRGACAYEDCELPVRSRGASLCEGHYGQIRRGRPLTPLRPRLRFDACQIPGCLKKTKGRYCPMHRARIKRHGDPDVAIPHSERNLPRGPEHPQWTTAPTYGAVHQRVHKALGSPTGGTCPCGGPAAQWAYIGPRQPGERLPYADDLALFEAMCVRCHKRMDMANIAAVEGKAS